MLEDRLEQQFTTLQQLLSSQRQQQEQRRQRQGAAGGGEGWKEGGPGGVSGMGAAGGGRVLSGQSSELKRATWPLRKSLVGGSQDSPIGGGGTTVRGQGSPGHGAGVGGVMDGSPEGHSQESGGAGRVQVAIRNQGRQVGQGAGGAGAAVPGPEGPASGSAWLGEGSGNVANGGGQEGGGAVTDSSQDGGLGAASGTGIRQGLEGLTGVETSGPLPTQVHAGALGSALGRAVVDGEVGSVGAGAAQAYDWPAAGAEAAAGAGAPGTGAAPSAGAEAGAGAGASMGSTFAQYVAPSGPQHMTLLPPHMSTLPPSLIPHSPHPTPHAAPPLATDLSPGSHTTASPAGGSPSNALTPRTFQEAVQRDVGIPHFPHLNQPTSTPVSYSHHPGVPMAAAAVQGGPVHTAPQQSSAPVPLSGATPAVPPPLPHGPYSSHTSHTPHTAAETGPPRTASPPPSISIHVAPPLATPSLPAPSLVAPSLTAPSLAAPSAPPFPGALPSSRITSRARASSPRARFMLPDLISVLEGPMSGVPGYLADHYLSPATAAAAAALAMPQPWSAVSRGVTGGGGAAVSQGGAGVGASVDMHGHTAAGSLAAGGTDGGDAAAVAAAQALQANLGNSYDMHAVHVVPAGHGGAGSPLAYDYRGEQGQGQEEDEEEAPEIHHQLA